ncbi:MAG: hypothetical protein LBV21_06855 [Candidatus Adiutrix sp.]|jgi:23S rRNA (uracil1939-C5)-methyltransferase|nr:hypothetical protein [Candidatus Adiutrix sp.]
MKPLVELEVEKLAPGGWGLARPAGGGTVLLPGFLPGEKVRVEPVGPSGGARRVRVLELLAASPDRAEPDCPLAGRCGGCGFLHVRPAAALALKARAALGDLADRAGLALELIPSPQPERYRARATFHLGRGAEGRWSPGFYDDRRHLVVVGDCRLLAPALTALLPPLADWAGRLPPEAGAELEIGLAAESPGPGRQIVISPPSPPPRPFGRRGGPAGRPPALPPALEPFLAGLAAEFERLDPAAALFARPFRGAAPRRLGPAGPDRLVAATWPRWNLALTAEPGGFTQVNPGLNRLMVEKILALAAPLAPGRALDLYSGLGNIAVPLLHSGFAVTAVEEAPESAAAARRNGRGRPGFTVVRGRSLEVTAELARRGQNFDLVVLDPPRAGARGLAPLVAALKPKLILYLACHPAVLDRDLPAFTSLGRPLKALIALDMFPRTSRLEALAAL